MGNCCCLTPPFFEGAVFDFAPNPTTYCGVSNWTLVQEWNSQDGDLTNITNYYDTQGWGHDLNGFAWSPDGTKLTLAGADDFIVTFSCSTPFDPETASQLAQRDSQAPYTNPTTLQYVSGGQALLFIHTVGDEISKIAATDYRVGTGSELSDLHKTDVSFTASGDDGSYTADDALSYMYYHGRVGASDHRLKYITFTSANLNNYSEVATSANFFGDSTTQLSSPAPSQTFSRPNIAGDKFYMVSSGFAQLITLDNGLGDLSSVSWDTKRDLTTEFSRTWTPNGCWINENDTTHIWVHGDNPSGYIQLAKFATNCG